MEGYAYGYPPPFPPMCSPDSYYPDHGDGFGEFYGHGPLNEDVERRPSRSKPRPRKARSRSRSRSDSKSRSQSRERDRSKSRSRSRSKSLSRGSRSRSKTCSRSRSGSRHKELSLNEPGFLDAFRVLYIASNKHNKNPSKFLVTQKRQDRIQEYLKSDRLGSKRWLFYPRKQTRSDSTVPEPKQSRETCDQRIKVDGDFFRKYRRSKKVDCDAPINKLKRWELVFYKKLGFVQAV